MVGDEWKNCFGDVAPAQEAVLSKRWCLPCRNMECKRAGIMSTKWLRRMATQAEVLDTPKLADPDKFEEVRKIDFPTSFKGSDDWGSPPVPIEESSKAASPGPSEGSRSPISFPPEGNTRYPATGLMVDGSAPVRAAPKKIHDPWSTPEEKVSVGAKVVMSNKAR